MTIKINYKKCCWKEWKCTGCKCGNSKCDGCVEVCPTGALERKKNIVYDKKLCTNCFSCIEACKQGAISKLE
ncbi:MAG: hypothetical protein QXG00_00905 [Candidatus Woesearchaeota archaeon]